MSYNPCFPYCANIQPSIVSTQQYQYQHQYASTLSLPFKKRKLNNDNHAFNTMSTAREYQYKQEIKTLQKHNKELKEINKSNQKQIENFNKIIAKLYKECVNGEEPRWDLIKVIQSNHLDNGIVRDQKLAILRSKIKSVYPAESYHVQATSKCANYKLIQQAVLDHVNLNGDYNSNCQIILKSDMNIMQNICLMLGIKNGVYTNIKVYGYGENNHVDIYKDVFNLVMMECDNKRSTIINGYSSNKLRDILSKIKSKGKIGRTKEMKSGISEKLKEFRQYYVKYINKDNNNNLFSLESQNKFDVMEKFKIGDNHRIPILKDQYGIRAKIDIPENTVCGQYLGGELSVDAFSKVFDGTAAEYHHNVYALDQEIKMKQMMKISDNDSYDIKNDNKFIIDPFIDTINWRSDNLLLLFINDCRANINDIYPTEEDNKYLNIQFVVMNVNGWPQTYLITTRAIQKGEELSLFYGERFGLALKLKMQNEEAKQSKKMKIDRFIQKMKQSL